MGNKTKIHEIAKRIGVSSKEVLEKARDLGIEASSHLSGVEEEEAKRSRIIKGRVCHIKFVKYAGFSLLAF